jgi:alpha-galactosidase
MSRKLLWAILLAIAPGAARAQVQASVEKGACRIRWEVRDAEPHVILHRPQCSLPFEEQAELIGGLIEKVIGVSGPGVFRTLFWGRIYPDGEPDPTLAGRLAVAAKKSPAWNAATGRPRAGDVNGFVRKLAEEAGIYGELREQFIRRGLDLRIASVEKVLVMRAGRLPFYPRIKAAVRPADRLPFDFQLWFSIAPAGAKPILTPKPGPEPRINGPKVYGARPGRPFLYRIPCTGQRPLKFGADGLPASLKLDPATGIVTGTAPPQPGEYAVTLRASNSHGRASRPFRLVVGDTLALTPPMGWNDWYSHYERVTDKMMREAADAMISSGMADFGYQYVNIDDCWMVKPGSPDPELGGPERDDSGALRPNRRFPDMKALTDYIHSKGLKAGLYTSPGPFTCAKFAGSWQHEEIDARKFAEWGFDFLKYDWCSYGRVAGGETVEHRKKPYALMGSILRSLDRDIVFNLCQYGMSEVWKWGGEVGGHAWRTTGDLGLEKHPRLPGFYSIAFKNAEHYEYAAPGRWNDPDYILIGSVGDAHNIHELPKPTTLTADEQYSYMSLWALMAAPLIFSGDMTRLDDFTLNVLCNAEVIDVDQDPLGRQARIVRKSEDEFVLAKPLEDGSLALGLFNLSDAPRRMAASFSELGLSGRLRVRDLWRQRELGPASDRWEAEVAPHGVSFVKLRK